MRNAEHKVEIAKKKILAAKVDGPIAALKLDVQDEIRSYRYNLFIKTLFASISSLKDNKVFLKNKY